MEPDELCKTTNEADVKIKAVYRDGYVLLEGDSKTLEFLGNLLIAQARSRKDCGFQIAYDAAGKAFFDKSSNVGLYIHRLPCSHHKKVEDKPTI